MRKKPHISTTTSTYINNMSQPLISTYLIYTQPLQRPKTPPLTLETQTNWTKLTSNKIFPTIAFTITLDFYILINQPMPQTSQIYTKNYLHSGPISPPPKRWRHPTKSGTNHKNSSRVPKTIPTKAKTIFHNKYPKALRYPLDYHY